MGVGHAMQGNQSQYSDNQEGWDGEGSGRGFQEGWDICTLMLIHVGIWQKAS